MSGLECPVVIGQPTPVRGMSRVVRGVSLAVTSATLADAAHAVGGGMVPDFGLTLLLTVGVAAVGVALADRRRSLGVILLTLGAAQVATHVLLSLASDASDGMSSGAVAPVPMTAAHAAAVVLTAVLLAKADAVVFGLAQVLARLLPRLLVGPPATGRLAVPRRVVVVDRRVAVLLRLASPRRGPPVAA
jgi:hypothetical protein